MSRRPKTREGSRIRWIHLILALTVLAAGCATSRGIIDVRVQNVANPATGAAVRIARVNDERHFERRPRHPSIPSLKHGHIDDPAITARAIARKRNGYGKALGDILLPQGRTVADVTRAVVTRGLREAGFRVLEQGEPGYADATPLTVDVQQFWAWFTPGFFAGHLVFEARITVKGDVAPFRNGLAFRSHLRRATQAPTGHAWRRVIDGGVQNLGEQMRTRVAASTVRDSQAPGALAPASPTRP